MGLFTDGFKLLKKASEPLYKTPKSIQETIEIMAVAENGIFEVSKNKYSKCYRFQDINYTTATEDEQIGIFERYCKFLNSLDCNYKITINNKNKNMDELRDKVLIAEKNDGFNNYRRIYNDIIEEKIIEGRQGIEQERYLTITIERKNFEEAKAQFATLEATIHKGMGVDMKVKAIYDSEIGNITRSEKNWKDVLKVAGQLYRYEFDNIVMVTAQRPPEKSTLMADYDTWKKVGRYVKRGAKGCAIFPSRALNPRMRYIFDISDTGGKNVKLTWDLEGENLKDYVDFLVSEGQIEQYDNSDRESLKNILKQFTGTDVWIIIKEEFGDRMTELMQLSGSVIKEESKKRNGLQQEMDMEQLVYASVMYAVGTRCGFDLSVQEQDFSQIVNIKDEEIIYRLGSIVCDVSCSVLREFSRNLKAIESERRIGYVRRNDLQGSGRTALSADRDAGRDGGSHEAGQIRKDGDELSKGERAGKIQDADEIREDVREDAKHALY